jgi:hypothetical protein
MMLGSNPAVHEDVVVPGDMKRGLGSLVENGPLISALLSFALAQLAKMVLTFTKTGNWDVTR